MTRPLHDRSLAVGVLEALVLVHPVVRARQRTVPLMLSLVVVIFGVLLKRLVCAS